MGFRGQMRNLVFRAEPNDAASCAPADANALPPCPGHADIVFAIRNGFLKRWTVAVASTGGRQLGAKTHGDYELTMQRKTTRQLTVAVAVPAFYYFGWRAAGADDLTIEHG